MLIYSVVFHSFSELIVGSCMEIIVVLLFGGNSGWFGVDNRKPQAALRQHVRHSHTEAGLFSGGRQRKWYEQLGWLHLPRLRSQSVLPRRRRNWLFNDADPAFYFFGEERPRRRHATHITDVTHRQFRPLFPSKRVPFGFEEFVL